MFTNDLLKLTITEQVAGALLFCALLIQLYHYLRYYIRVLTMRESKKKTIPSFPPLSVVIAAKNEAYNLSKFLPFILEQDYPNFEVVVVDDSSEDDSWDILQQFKAKYPHLYSTRIHFNPVFSHGKKMALSLGIKAAKNEYLVLTDADCKPASKTWLRNIARNYTSGIDIVIGYSPYKKTKGLLNHIIRYDNVFTGIQYLGSALAKKTYMGVGRNLSYNKALFFNNKGFSPHNQMISGDDDLFINKVANSSNCAVEISSDSLIYTESKSTWKDWAIQKRRHITTGTLYKRGDKWRLGMELVSRFFFYAAFIFCLTHQVLIYPALAIFGLRFLLQGFIINATAKKLSQATFIFSFWLLDIVIPLINAWFAIKNASNPKGLKWK